MTVTLESTTKIVRLDGMPTRVWEGQTDSGIPVHAYLARIAVAEGREAEDYARFEQELQACRAPSPEVAAIPLRLIL